MTTTTEAKSAVVTGAAGGVGACFARQLAKRGYHLLLVDRRKEPIEKLCDELTAQHDLRIESCEVDLTNEEAVETLAERMVRMSDLELLVNNAGFGIQDNFADVDVEPLLNMIRLHTMTPARLIRAVLPGMIERDCGAIINLGSLGAWAPGVGYAQYAATKSYLITLSEALHQELRGTNVCVQALCPGFVKTEFHGTDEMHGFEAKQVPKRLWMSPDEVVTCSLDSLPKRRAVVIPGWRNRLLGWAMRAPIARPIVNAVMRQNQK